MPPRAAPLSPDERRATLIEATLPLLAEHGRRVTTRQIAEAAGVAEGTIFRVFDSKEELIEAAIEQAFEPGQLVEEMEAIGLDKPLGARAIALVDLLQGRFVEIFALMKAVGMVAPPDRQWESGPNARRVERSVAAMVVLFEPDRASLTVTPLEVVQRLRLLTFAGSHPEITGGVTLSAAEIVDTVLHGVVRRDHTTGGGGA